MSSDYGIPSKVQSESESKNGCEVFHGRPNPWVVLMRLSDPVAEMFDRLGGIRPYNRRKVTQRTEESNDRIPKVNHDWIS